MESESLSSFLKLIKEQILSDPESLNVKDLIGIGTIGKVYKIEIPNEKQVFALKVISKNFPKNYITTYINFLQKIKKPYFAKFYEYFEDDKNYYFIMEYYQYNLNHFMKGGMQINHIFKIIEKLNTILLELNSKNFIFKNIKPDNIFIVNNSGNLEDNFDVILSDCCNIYFFLFHEYPMSFAFKNFFAPEIRHKGNLDIKSELWNLGRLIYTLLFASLTESNPYFFEFKYFDCIKYEKLKLFLLGLIESKLQLRKNWEQYIQEFSQIKENIRNKAYEEIIDVFKIYSSNPTSALLNPTEEFYNIIIELTELSKEEYVNEDTLCPEHFDFKGNRGPYQYSKNEKRGGEKYVPPWGWTGIGLNVSRFLGWEIKCGSSGQEGEWVLRIMALICPLLKI